MPWLVALIAPGLWRKSGEIRSRRAADADHLPLSALHVADGAGGRGSERARPVRGRGGGADHPQRGAVGGDDPGRVVGLHDRPEAAIILAWAVTVAGFAQLRWLAIAASRKEWICASAGRA